MLHHYNYTSTLSQILSYHQQLEEQSINENNDHSTSSSTLCEELKQQVDSSRSTIGTNNNIINNNNNNTKSFTIEAILGLKSDSGEVNHSQSPDLSSVVNLSVHHQTDPTTDRSLVSSVNRLQLPVRHHSSSSVAVTGHYTVGHGCAPNRHTVRNLKHLPSVIPNGKKSCKSKRVRTIFTPEQLERLEAEFERQQYMVGPERLYLAHTLQLTEAQVKVWFQNRRIKWRKHHLELTHQRLAALKQQQLLLDDSSHPDVQDNNSSSTDT